MSSFRILKQRNYQLYFGGQVVSVTGSWVQQVTMTWLIYRWTGSSAWVGAMTFATQIPGFILSSVAGVLGDRYSRKKIFIYSQYASAMQATAVAALILSGSKNPEIYFCLAVLLGCINAFEITSRFGLVVDLGEREDWSHAISLNSMTMQGTRILGPAIAGAFIALNRETLAFAFNALSFIPIIAALSQTKVKNREIQKSEKSTSVFESFKEVLRYSWGHFGIRKILLAACLMSCVTAGLSVLLPVVSSLRLGGNATTFSWLNSANATGAMLGAFSLTLGSGSTRSLRREIMVGLFFLSCALGVFAISTSVWLTAAAITGFGYCTMRIWPKLNIALQKQTEDRYRGRTNALWNMTYMGTTPIASVAIGWAADRWNPALVLSGIGSIIFLGVASQLYLKKTSSTID